MDTTYTVPAPEENPIVPVLAIDETAKGFLLEAARWAKFLAILGFIAVGFMVLAGIFASAFSSTVLDEYNISTSVIAVVYLIFALIYFFPFLYLFNFSSKTRKALRVNDQFALNLGLSNLKSHYKYVGVLAIIMLIIWAVAIIGISIGASLVS